MAAGGVHGSTSVRSAHGKRSDRKVAQQSLVSALHPLVPVFAAAVLGPRPEFQEKENGRCT